MGTHMQFLAFILSNRCYLSRSRLFLDHFNNLVKYSLILDLCVRFSICVGIKFQILAV